MWYGIMNEVLDEAASRGKTTSGLAGFGAHATSYYETRVALPQRDCAYNQGTTTAAMHEIGYNG